MNKIRGNTVGTPLARGAVTDDTAVSKKAWSSRHTVDVLCPSFSEKGSAVRCEPVEGYPLKVTTDLPTSESGISKITLTQSGKNLFDYTEYTFENYLITHAHGVSQASSGFSAVLEYIPIPHLRGLTITLNHPACEKTPTTSAGLAFYDADEKYISGSSGYSHTVPENAEYMRFTVPREYADGTQVQIEIGSVVTEYEPHWQWEHNAELDEPVFEGGSHVWSNIRAHAGVNTIWSSVGATTVEGRADPVAIIEKLTQAVLSMGSNI